MRSDVVLHGTRTVDVGHDLKLIPCIYYARETEMVWTKFERNWITGERVDERKNTPALK